MGEDEQSSAFRETAEEVGVELESLYDLFHGTLENDSCLGGADIHEWHAYGAKVDANKITVNLDEEGSSWGWYDSSLLNEANTVPAVLMLIERIEMPK